MDQNGELFHSLIGPYNEGDRLFLVCETEGGKLKIQLHTAINKYFKNINCFIFLL